MSIFYFIKLILKQFFDKFSKNAIDDLFNKFSYRYDAKAEKSILLTLKYFITSFKLIWKKNNLPLVTQSICVYEVDENIEKELNEYFKQQLNQSINIIYQNNLPNNLTNLHKFIFSIELFFLVPFFFIYSLFFKRKGKISLILLELTEIELISDFLKRSKCKEFYHFCSFEKHIYFLSHYFINQNGINVNLMPSPNPLHFYYKKIYCTKIIFSASYQLEEYKKFYPDWNVKEIIHWPPFNNSQIVRYNNEKFKYKLGFISSGMHLRRLKNLLSPTDDNDYKAEMALLNNLKNYLMANPKERLLIYLHPVEKKNEVDLNRAKEFYNNHFKDCFEFSDIAKNSKEQFNLCELTLASFSSAQIERLFGGYKILFTPFEFLKDYFSDKRLNSVTIYNQQEFNSAVDNILNIDTNEYFQKFDLKSYHYKFHENQ